MVNFSQVIHFTNDFNCLKMHLVQAECTQEHKSQFKIYFTCSLQVQEMKHMSVLCNIWPIWPDLRKKIDTKTNIDHRKSNQMLTLHFLGVVNHSLQFDLMNKLRILVDFYSWCELGRVAILEFFRFFIINKTDI